MTDVELNNLYGHLHRIFQQILNETAKGVPFHYQVRLVLHSSLLKYPITFSFMSPQRLITERILAEFQRVILSNQKFRLNDIVDVNVIHVSLPPGRKGSKRSEVNVGKHLNERRSIKQGEFMHDATPLLKPIQLLSDVQKSL